jgi:hypothetical protein
MKACRHRGRLQFFVFFWLLPKPLRLSFEIEETESFNKKDRKRDKNREGKICR